MCRVFLRTAPNVAAGEEGSGELSLTIRVGSWVVNRRFSRRSVLSGRR